MARSTGSAPRPRGNIRRRGASYQVRVYAGIDPLTGRQLYLTGSTTDAREARKILTRLQAQVDEQRNARTNATLGTALDAWLRVHEVEETTRQAYEGYIRLYIRPALGEVPVGRVTAQMLEEFYAELRRCRARCGGRPRVEHRTSGPHECRTVRHRRRPDRPSTRPEEHDCTAMRCEVVECRPHVCRPLSASTIRQVHFTISAALAAAVRWDWITSNPAEVAKKPRQPHPQPNPPTAEQAAQIITAAWAQDADWGTLVWLAMVTGMRRGELLALRWSHVDLAAGVLCISRNYIRVPGHSIDKDTKTHQVRRIALDATTVDVLTAHRRRYADQANQLGQTPTKDAYLFSYAPLHDRPCNPDAVSHRYTKMCAGLGIDSHLHALRHYTATELIASGVDLRAVAGRLGHGGGGATTLRVYAAWVAASDQRAAEVLGAKMPKRRPRPTAV
jgi:integrase